MEATRPMVVKATHLMRRALVYLCPSGERACAVTSRSTNLPGHRNERRTVEWQRRAVERVDWRD